MPLAVYKILITTTNTHPTAIQFSATPCQGYGAAGREPDMLTRQTATWAASMSRPSTMVSSI